MKTFDSEFDRILAEAVFGGNPYEQATGIKRHMTFEGKRSSSGDSVDTARKFRDIDIEACSPQVKEFLEYYQKMYRLEDSGGGAIKTASTQPGSEIQRYFINKFGNVLMSLTLNDEYLMYTVPERVAGQMISYVDDQQPTINGLHLLAQSPLYGADVQASTEGLHVNGATYGPEKTVAEILQDNLMTLEVHVKRTNPDANSLLDTFFPLSSYK